MSNHQKHKPYRCGYCREVGHNDAGRRCPTRTELPSALKRERAAAAVRLAALEAVVRAADAMRKAYVRCPCVGSASALCARCTAERAYDAARAKVEVPRG